MHLNNMWKQKNLFRLRLQFFAEGAADGGGAEEAAGGSDNQPAGQETAETTTTKKVYTQEDATEVAKQFKMIPHNAVKDRFKSTFDKAGKYDQLASHFGAISEKYGVPLDNPEGLVKAILTDKATVKAYANEQGVSEEVAKSIVEANALNEMNKAREAARVRQEEYTRMSEEENTVKAEYPGFDFEKASGNKAFKTLVDNGIPMKDAYEMSHHAELTAAALEAARAQGRADAEEAMRQATERPKEGAAGYTGNAQTDVSKLHGAALDAFLESFLTR